jgi:hypothetical protein
MRVEQLVRELGIRLGLPLALDGNGMCRLVLDGGTTVDLEALRDDGEKFVIYAVLGKLRPGPREAIYRALLEANLPSRDGTAGVLALDGDRDEIILQRILDATSLNAVYLSEILSKWRSAGQSGSSVSTSGRDPREQPSGRRWMSWRTGSITRGPECDCRVARQPKGESIGQRSDSGHGTASRARPGAQ